MPEGDRRWKEAEMRWTQPLRRSLRILLALGFASGCQGLGAPATPTVDISWLSEEPRGVDTISKASVEENRWILGVLLESPQVLTPLPPPSGLAAGYDPVRMTVEGTDLDGELSLECKTTGGVFGPAPDIHLKRLDPMHPEAIAPQPTWLVGVGNRGWITWQVSLPPSGCRYHLTATIWDTAIAEWDIETPAATPSPVTLRGAGRFTQRTVVNTGH
jgi:hypothetical protein